MKKWQRISLFSVAILAVVFLLANFGLNFWLKNNLPNYIKNNSDYLVTYKTLDVELVTGNIFATGISVHSKNPENQNVIGLQGTVDTLEVSRFGIFDALFRKRINSTDLNLKSPNLNVVLAKPINEKTGKKRNPILFENIKINNGNVTIFRHTKQKFVAVNGLNLKVENLQMTEESVENKLPIVFDNYEIQGKNFFFRPDNLYILKAQNITTKNGLMNIKNFQLIPLLSYPQFTKYFPKKRNLFDFSASEMDFKDIVLTENRISLSNLTFQNPDLKMYTSNAKPEEKQKSFKYEVNLDDIAMKNAKIQIFKDNYSKLFSGETMNLNLSKMKMDEETAKGNIPFSYEKFLISGKNLNYFSDFQDVKVNSLAVNPKSFESRGISIKPLVSSSKKPLINLTLNHIFANVNDWKLENNKLKLNVENIVLDALNGKITAPENNERKKLSLHQIELPLKVKDITVKNSNIVIDRLEKPLTFNSLYANIKNLEMNEETVKKEIPLKVGSYTFTTKNFNYRTKFYTFSAGLFKFEKDNFSLNNFEMKPNFSRSQFIKMIPMEKDLYDIKIQQITGNGIWDFVSDKKLLTASNVNLNGMNANIFRSKIPNDDTTIKPMYSELLRKINLPLFIDNLNVTNSVLVYEEDTEKSDGPGKLTFGNFNMNVKNLNSAKISGKQTTIPITIRCAFMNASPMNVKWNFDTAKPNDDFTISGNISDLPASSINPFIEPYLKIRATGTISDLVFNFKGNKSVLNGTLNMKHQNLKVAILKKTGEKNKVLSALANMVVKTDSEIFPESVFVENVHRDFTKSFFNFFWQGIQQGLKKTLIGKNIDKTEKVVKNTVKNTKQSLEQNKQDLKETKQNVKEKVQNMKEKGIFKRIFKKKTEE